MNANVGLAIQCTGVVLLTLLSLSMRESIQSAALSCWIGAWASLALALTSLFAGFHLAGSHGLFYSLYLFGEYAFGLLLIAGCRHLVRGVGFSSRYWLALIPAALVAIVLPLLSADFNGLFMMQAIILAVFFFASALTLWPALREHGSPGLRVMTTALLLLTINFLDDVLLFGARKELWGFTVPTAYLRYTSIFDLILQVLLGFGMMM